jgi:tetratricopeptide (TPR) repeat protein
LTTLGAFALGLAIVLVPVAARNYFVGGGFYLTTSQFGPNFFIGNNPRSDGTYMSLRPGRGAPEYERQDATELAEHALGRRLTPAEVSTYWTDRALGFVTSQPGAWLRLQARKLLLLWNADEMLDTESQQTHAEWSWPLRVLGPLGHFGILVPLALVGVWATWPDRRRLWVFHAMIVAYAASVLMFYVFARYRFPLVPLLMPFAAVAVARLADAALAAAGARAAGSRDGRAPRAGWLSTAAALLIASAVFTNWPLLEAATMQAVTENNIAVALQEQRRFDDAIAHYRRALEFKPDYAPAYNNMGTALRAKGAPDEAIDAYRRALETMPDYPDAHYNLANVLLDKNRPDEAAEHLRIALRAIPASAGARNNLGIALAAEGKFEAAVVEFQQALAADPGSAKAHKNMGSALSELGRLDEAIGYLRKATELDPQDAEGHYDLGHTYLQAGRFVEAAAALRRALELRPDSAAAHNNLGIALASQGLFDEAIAHWREALKLDPDFADARKNLEIALKAR